MKKSESKFSLPITVLVAILLASIVFFSVYSGFSLKLIAEAQTDNSKWHFALNLLSPNQTDPLRE